MCETKCSRSAARNSAREVARRRPGRECLSLAEDRPLRRGRAAASPGVGPRGVRARPGNGWGGDMQSAAAVLSGTHVGTRGVCRAGARPTN